MSRKKVIRFFIGVVSIALLAVLVVEGIVFVSSTMLRSPLRGLENQIVDLAFQARITNKNHSKVSTEDVVIIDIDDESIDLLGRPQLWPRAYDAYVIAYVSSGLPKAIGIDYLYTETDTLPAAYADILAARGFSDTEDILAAMSTDPELAMAIENAGNVYLALFDDDSKDADSSLTFEHPGLRTIQVDASSNYDFRKINHPVFPVLSFSEGAKAVGSIDMSTTQDGTVRNYRLFQELYSENQSKHLLANFPFYMALDGLNIPDSAVIFNKTGITLGDSIQIPLQKNGSFRINWLGSDDEIRFIPIHKILSGRVPAEFFEGKYVFFGTSASGMQDLKTVPSSSELMPGAEVHVVAFLNMMNNAFIQEVSDSQAAPWFILLSILFASVFLLLKPFIGFIMAIASVFAEMFFFIIWFLPTKQIMFPIVTLMLITVFCYLFSSLFIYFIRERNSRRMKQAFGTYVSPEVVDQISKETSTLNLGGEKKELTVLFSDIRAFTSYSEKLDPEQIVEILNDYLSEMSDCVLKQKGTIDKFIGDAIMAIFGAPVSLVDHPYRACAVAIDMIKELAKFNVRHEAKGHSALEVGIGINTGMMTVGNIGSQKRFDYTVIGDEVNLASRLEGLTKYFGVDIIISKSTLESCAKNKFAVRALARVIVKGKDIPVEVYELIGFSSELDKNTKESLLLWEKAIDSFMKNELKQALAIFQEYSSSYPEDEPAKIYQRKCTEFIANPESYRDTFTMDSK